MGDGSERQTTERPGTVLTVLFADVADSSRILMAGGDEGAHAVMRQCMERMMEAAVENGGEVVDQKGDEVLCVFADPARGSQAAIDMQMRIAQLSEDHPELPRIALRIGFEHGSVIQADDGIFGATIYSAARLVELAKGAQVLTTRETVDAMKSSRDLLTRAFGRQVLRGQPREREILEVMWDAAGTPTWMAGPQHPLGARIDHVELRYGDREFRVDASRPRLELGRSPTSDLEVTHEAVSRIHARLSWNSGRVMVEDVSTNGTLIEPQVGKVVPIHHEKMNLTGRGLLRLGTLQADVDAPVVSYRCVEMGSD